MWTNLLTRIATTDGNMAKKRITRRKFVSTGIKAGALFYIVPRHVLGGHGYTPPSEVITRAVIGTGGMGIGGHVIENKQGQPPETLAVCDVDQNHLAKALKKAGPGCEVYSDWRRVLDRNDIDTIHIATPPHWHALMAIAAAQAGFDILGEKPLSHSTRTQRGKFPLPPDNLALGELDNGA